MLGKRGGKGLYDTYEEAVDRYSVGEKMKNVVRDLDTHHKGGEPVLRLKITSVSLIHLEGISVKKKTLLYYLKMGPFGC